MYPVSSQYLDAVRNGGRYTVVCDAYRNGLRLPGGKDLPIASGSVTDDSRPGVRRKLAVDLSPEPGKTVQSLFDLLAPIGTELRIRSVLTYPNGTATEVVPMGVFDVDAEQMGYGPGGTLSVTASDKWVKIQRARFLVPQVSNPALTVKAQIAALIRGALGADEPVNILASSPAMTSAVVWERDRDKAINELAKSIGAWAYFDRDGVATIEDLPTTQVPVVTIDAGEDGVLLDATRSRDRSKTYNVVVVNSDKVDDVPLFATQYVWDSDPTSPTFAATGTGSGSTPPVAGTGGAFELVPYFYTSPLLENTTQALAAGRTILARVKGLNAQLSMSILRNHALDSGMDAATVRLPQERWDVQRPVEIHAIDKIVHPLTVEADQSIDTRSTRTDEESSE